MKHLAPRIQFLWEDWERRTGEKGARIGCALYSLHDKTGIGWDEEKWFSPASNNKLWTMAVALDRLGSQYRWVTQIYAVGKTIGIKGGGDPVFSFSDAVKVAQLLKQRGIRRIERLILDDHSFEALPWGEGWMWDDLAAGYGAPVHAINMEGNRVSFSANPSENVPHLTWSPSLPTIHVDARLTWTDQRESDLQIRRSEKENRFFLTGLLSRHDPEEEGAVWSGPHFFAEVFLEACRQVGIEMAVKIEVIEGPMEPGPLPPLEYRSPSLAEILPRVGADSDNMVAEVLLKTMAMEESGRGSAELGQQIVMKTLNSWGIEPPAVYADGSGLSMYNLSSPKQYVQLLQSFLNHASSQIFIESLSLYGKKGTLQDREGALPMNVNVLAKTGSLAGVSNLSGYLTVGKQVHFIFSLLVQGLLDEKHGEQLQDDLVQLLASAAASADQG